MEIGLRGKILLAILLIGLIVGIILIATLGRSGGGGDDDDTQIAPGLVGKFIYESGSGVSADYEKDIQAALKTWDEIINDDVKINVSFYSYSSNDDTLAFAFMNDEDDIYGGGVVYINTYNKAETSMENILEHEIGHVLGIGTSKKWDEANNSTVLDKKLFPEAYNFYKDWAKKNGKEININGVPLGSKGYHWSEEVFDIEMMTPFSEKKGVELPISGLTLNALKDIGWDVDLEKAEMLTV